MDAVSRHGRVYLAIYLTDQMFSEHTSQLMRGKARPLQGPDLRIEFDGAITPIPELLEACRGVGHANLVRDKDGKMRHYLAVAGHGGAVYPSLPLVLARHFLGEKGISVQCGPDGTLLLGGDRKIKLDDKGSFLYQPYPTLYTYYSAADVVDSWNAADEASLAFFRKEFPEIVSTSSKKLMTQVNALLDIRRMEEGKLKLNPKPKSPSILVREIQQEYRVAGKRTELSIEAYCLVPDDVMINVDADVFYRILGNLLWNAIKHARQHSVIEIGTRTGSNGGIECFVSNAGRPIPTEMHGRLFSAFISGSSGDRGEKIPSTGLGLTFCKLAVEAHGGQIQLLSPRPGHADGVEVRLEFERFNKQCYTLNITNKH